MWKSIQRLNNLRLQNKIILLAVLSLVCSTGLVGLTAQGIATRVIERNTYRHTNETIQQSAKYLNEKLLNLIHNIQNLLTSDAFRTSIYKLIEEGAPPIGEFSKQERLLTQQRITNPLLESIYVYTPKMIFYDTTKGRIDRARFVNSAIYRKLTQERVIYWGVAGEARWLPKEREVIPIVLTTGIERIKPEQALVIAHIKEDELVQYLSELRNLSVAETYLVDGGSKVVTHGYQSSLAGVFRQRRFLDRVRRGESGYFRYRRGGAKLLVNYATLPINGWKLVTLTPEEQLLGDIRYIRWFICIFGGLSLGLSVFLSTLVSRSITKPLSKLQAVMKRVRNREFSARFEPKYDDEVGELATDMNRMLDEINLLFTRLHEEQEKLKLEQRLKQAAEFKALQSQINPHFLYNALDSIYWKSLLGGNEQVAEMVISLATFFRLGLNKGKDEISIEQELRHVENYLSLQKNIYDGKFDYAVQADPEILDCPVIKFILQPLAENAIVHGFSELRQGGLIRVNAVRDGERIRLEVGDNGKGFDAEALRAGGTGKTGYALSNIQQRLTLRYGAVCQMELTSGAGWETVIRIWIPVLKEE